MTAKCTLKIFPIAFLLLLSCQNTPSASLSKSTSDTKKPVFLNIHRVVDGDTFWLTDEKGERAKVRFIGIDAPEVRNYGKKIKQYFGEESSDFLAKYLKGKKVRLEYDVQKYDQYGRTLAYVFMEDGTFLNDYLVKCGFAVASTYPPNVKYQAKFLKSERYARQKKLGMWAEKQ